MSRRGETLLRYYPDFNAKTIEPVKRKHGSLLPEWQMHRFPIKGGISMRDALAYDMLTSPNRTIKIEDDGQVSFRGIPVRIA
jgi:hypothetical protein